MFIWFCGSHGSASHILHRLPLMMGSEFKARIYKSNELECNKGNDLKLDCIYSCLYCLALQYKDRQPETAVRVFEKIVDSLFDAAS